MYELVTGLNQLCEVEDGSCDSLKAFFGDLEESDSSTEFSSDSDGDDKFTKDSMFATTDDNLVNSMYESDLDF